MAHRSLASFSKLLLPLNGLDLDGLPTLPLSHAAASPCSLASILKSEFSRSVVPVTVATYCSRGAFFGGMRALGLGIVGGVVWSWTSCSAACGLLVDLCVLPVDALAGVSILHALSGGHFYQQTAHLYFGSYGSVQIDSPPVLSRAPSHDCCIRDYDRPRACVVLYVYMAP